VMDSAGAAIMHFFLLDVGLHDRPPEKPFTFQPKIAHLIKSALPSSPNPSRLSYIPLQPTRYATPARSQPTPGYASKNLVTHGTRRSIAITRGTAVVVIVVVDHISAVHEGELPLLEDIAQLRVSGVDQLHGF